MPPLANEKKLEVHMVVKLFAILTFVKEKNHETNRGKEVGIFIDI